MREHERRPREICVPQAHPPGHAQVDLGEVTVIIGGVEQKAHFLALDLPRSDACYISACPPAMSEAPGSRATCTHLHSSGACRCRCTETVRIRN